MSQIKNLSGQIFDRLVVLAISTRRTSGGKAIWLCRCECGNEVEVVSCHLITRNTRSCGCLNRELTSKRRITHGGSNTSEYNSWSSMLNRCTNSNSPNYHYYGGRGITVCDRWLYSFENFYADIGPKPTPDHSIDRSDNYGNYEPGNCRWATPEEQANNARTTTSYNYKGMDYNLSKLSREFGVSRTTLHRRLTAGWSVKDAIETPVN